MTTRTARLGTDQLTLLSTPDVPLQFRLDERTRRLGLANLASIKAQLAEQEARRLAHQVVSPALVSSHRVAVAA